MKTKENKDIRAEIENAGAYLWQIAELVGIGGSTLSIWMRKPLEGERRERVLAAIQQYKAQGGNV